MSKAIATMGLVGLICTGAFAPASAAPLLPLSQSVIGALSGDIIDVGWRRYWRDRWGVRRLFVAVNGVGVIPGARPLPLILRIVT